MVITGEGAAVSAKCKVALDSNISSYIITAAGYLHTSAGSQQTIYAAVYQLGTNDKQNLPQTQQTTPTTLSLSHGLV